MPKTFARILRAGTAYFAMVFGAGFFLGAIRVPFLAPRLGERTAELIEMPFMFLVIVMSARFITRRFNLPPGPVQRLGVGFLALMLLLAAEILLAVALQDRTIIEYLASRDPVSGSVYLAMLGIFALLPFAIAMTTSLNRRR